MVLSSVQIQRRAPGQVRALGFLPLQVKSLVSRNEISSFLDPATRSEVHWKTILQLSQDPSLQLSWGPVPLWLNSLKCSAYPFKVCPRDTWLVALSPLGCVYGILTWFASRYQTPYELQPLAQSLQEQPLPPTKPHRNDFHTLTRIFTTSHWHWHRSTPFYREETEAREGNLFKMDNLSQY